MRNKMIDSHSRWLNLCARQRVCTCVLPNSPISWRTRTNQGRPATSKIAMELMNNSQAASLILDHFVMLNSAWSVCLWLLSTTLFFSPRPSLLFSCCSTAAWHAGVMWIDNGPEVYLDHVAEASLTSSMQLLFARRGLQLQQDHTSQCTCCVHVW